MVSTLDMMCLTLRSNFTANHWLSIWVLNEWRKEGLLVWTKSELAHPAAQNLLLRIMVTTSCIGRPWSTFLTGWLTWWHMNSNSSLKVASSLCLCCPLVSSKFTSVKSMPMVCGMNLSKSLNAKSRLIPLPSAVPVLWNALPSTPSISKEIQYLESA